MWFLKVELFREVCRDTSKLYEFWETTSFLSFGEQKLAVVFSIF